MEAEVKSLSTVVINKNILERILINNNFSPRKTLKDWSVKNHLQKSSTGKYACHTCVDGVKAYYVTLNLDLGGKNERYRY